jgi:hypothetical protein
MRPVYRFPILGSLFIIAGAALKAQETTPLLAVDSYEAIYGLEAKINDQTSPTAQGVASQNTQLSFYHPPEALFSTALGLGSSFRGH